MLDSVDRLARYLGWPPKPEKPPTPEYTRVSLSLSGISWLRGAVRATACLVGNTTHCAAGNDSGGFRQPRNSPAATTSVPRIAVNPRTFDLTTHWAAFACSS